MFIEMYHLQAGESGPFPPIASSAHHPSSSHLYPNIYPNVLQAGPWHFCLMLSVGEVLPQGSSRIYTGPPYNLFTKVSLTPGNL